MSKAILIAAALAAAPLAAQAQSPDAALEKINRQLAESPGDAQLLASRGRLHFLLGDYEAAAADLWNATQADPAIRQDATLQIMRGRAVLQGGKPEAASRVFESIQGRDTEEARAAFYAADAYSQLGEEALARAALARAVALDPDFRAAQVRLDQLGGDPDGETPDRVAQADAARPESAPADSADLSPAEADAMLDLQGPSVDAQAGDEALLDLRRDEDAPNDVAAPENGSITQDPLNDGPVSLSEVEPAGDEPGDAAGEEANTAADPDAAMETDISSEPDEPDESEAEETNADAPEPARPGGSALEILRAAASNAPVEALRQDISQARANGDTNAELDALRDLYVREAADQGEIARFAELTGLTVSDDPVRDFRLARLAEMARHTRLAAALYRGVEQSGDFEGRNLAIVRGNLATQLRTLGNYSAALDAANGAIEADESYGNAWAVKGLILHDRGDVGEALPVMKEAYDRGARAPELLDHLRQAGMAVDSGGSASPQ